MSTLHRVRNLNQPEESAGGEYVLYWMQQSQRSLDNPALEFALARANSRNLPLVVGFALTEDYPQANARHYAFMLDGLRDVAAALQKRGIAFALKKGAPVDVVLGLAKKAALAVCDRGYLRHQEAWRREVAARAKVPVFEVEGDVVVPVALASSKAEFAARTLRPKIHKLFDDFIDETKPLKVKHRADHISVKSDVDIRLGAQLVAKLKIDQAVAPVMRLKGGEREAQRLLKSFIRGALHRYGLNRNEPADFIVSYLSPYLHFGQISPVHIVGQIRKADTASVNRLTFIEELVVRRELAANFVSHVQDYDSYECLPAWAKQTLHAHRKDRRPALYTQNQLDAGTTHDPYWNAAMHEMKYTGYMHNYMRMYWAKKILEWSKSPQAAYETVLFLNNRYFLDGRDMNSYANVAWCFGLHDRPWGERSVFGKVRYMNAKGLERKFDIEKYVSTVDALVKAEASGPKT